MTSDEPYGGDEKENENLGVKSQLLERMFDKGIRIPDGDLADIFDIDVEDVKKIKELNRRRATDTTDKPLTYDYAFVFNVGEEDKIRKPSSKEKELRVDDGNHEFDDEWENGVTYRKYYGQIIQEMKVDLERARLTVMPYKSANGKFIIFAVGISEKALESWANDRDTDLLLDPVEAVREGRKKDFPLAKRTILEEDTDMNHTLPLSNWHSMYAQYNPRANKKIYRHYPRISGDENSPMTVFDEKTRLRIIYEAIISDKGEGGAEVELVDHLNSTKHPLKACFPLHNQVELDDFEEDWLRNHYPNMWINVPLERIRNYFGEPIAFYFGFMTFYCRWLIAPAILGFIFFWVQIAQKQVDVPGIFVLSLFIVGWCVALVDFWLRQESRYRLAWGMTKFEEKAVSRPQFKGEWQHDDVTGLWTEDYWVVLRNAKSTCTMGGILFFLCLCITGVITILLFRDRNPKDLTVKVGLGVANGVMIFIFDIIYRYISRLGNEWENWRTEQDFQDALITKSFFFKFFNSFASLFYLAFLRSITAGTGFYIQVYGAVCEKCGSEDKWDPDGECETHSLEDNPSENKPYYKCCVKEGGYCTETRVQNDINKVILSDLQIQLASLFVTAIVIQNSLEVGLPFLIDYITDKIEEKEAKEKGEAIKPKSEAELQSELLPYENTIDDMAEIVIQFGYVTLFVVCLPLTPLLALINNMVELKVDGVNLVKSSQRPHPNGSYGLGAWNNVLSFFSTIAVGTNVALLVFRTSIVSSLRGGEADTAQKWIAFSVVSILLALIVAAEKAIIPDVPTEVNQGVARQRVIESVLVNHAILDDDGDEPPKTGEDDEDFKFDPTLPYVTPDDLEEAPTGRFLFLEKSLNQSNQQTDP